MAPIRQDLIGIDGWLLFWILGVALFAPLILLDQARRSHSVLVTVLNCLSAALGIIAGLVVAKRSASAFTWIGIFYWFALCRLCIDLGLAFAHAQQADLGRIGPQLGARMLIVMGWIFYFRKSERVRANFGRNL